ncbi:MULTISPECIES: hypothetical protein [Clostridium]|uniref:hypothetical protein n=1 Tax=Clostridium TaxID=1485 RepID=UPI000825B64B|nr:MULTISPECIES: hypothetical protein [Clostridium]
MINIIKKIRELKKLPSQNKFYFGAIPDKKDDRNLLFEYVNKDRKEIVECIDYLKQNMYKETFDNMKMYLDRQYEEYHLKKYESNEDENKKFVDTVEDALGTANWILRDLSKREVSEFMGTEYARIYSKIYGLENNNEIALVNRGKIAWLY